MNMKLTVVLFVVVILNLAVLGGCGKQGNNGESVSPQPPVAVDTAEDTPSQSPEETASELSPKAPEGKIWVR